MIRKDKICEFTDQDKQYLVVRKYSSDEVESNITAYNQNNNKRRIILLVLFIVSLFIMSAVNPLASAMGI